MEYKKPKIFVSQFWIDFWADKMAEKGLTVDDMWCELVVLKKISV